MVDNMKRAYPAPSHRSSSEESSKRQKVIHSHQNNIGAIDPNAENAPAKKFTNSKRHPGENTLNFHQAPPKMAPLRPATDFALPTPQQQTFAGLASQESLFRPVAADEMDLVKYLEASNFDDSEEGIKMRMDMTSASRKNARMASVPRRATVDGPRKEFNPSLGLFGQVFGMTEREMWDKRKVSGGLSTGPINPLRLSSMSSRDAPRPTENTDNQSENLASSGSNSWSTSANETSSAAQAPIDTSPSNEHTPVDPSSLAAGVASLNNLLAALNAHPSPNSSRTGFLANAGAVPTYPTNLFPPTTYIVISRHALEDTLGQLYIARLHCQALLGRTQSARSAHASRRDSLAALRDALPALRGLPGTLDNVNAEVMFLDQAIDQVAKTLQGLGNGAQSYL